MGRQHEHAWGVGLSQPHGGQHRPLLGIKAFHRVPGLFGDHVGEVARDPHLGQDVRRVVLDERHGGDVQAAAQHLVAVDDGLQHASRCARVIPSGSRIASVCASRRG